MNLQKARITYLKGVISASLATVFLLFPSSAQTNRVTALGLLKEVVGTWVSINPMEANGSTESPPFLVLKLREGNGSLIGSISHFNIRVDAHGTVIGTPLPSADLLLTDLTFWGAAIHFTWGGEPPLHGGNVVMLFDGTKAAHLLIPATPEEQHQVMVDDRATGFYPIIFVRREGESGDKYQNVSDEKRETQSFPAAVINAAEFENRFTSGVYVDYPTLVRSGQLRRTGYKLIVRPGIDPFSNYAIEVVVSPVGSSYRLSVQEKSSTACASRVVSDEAGIIYDGSPAGCETN
jgi:hypothetical protein